MKPYIVNRNCWHYNFNLFIVEQNKKFYRKEYAITYVESKNTVYSYWKMTLRNVIKNLVDIVFLFALVCFIIYCLYSLAKAFFVEPFIVFSVILFMAVIYSTVIVVTHVINLSREIELQSINSIVYPTIILEKTKKPIRKLFDNISIKVEFKE